MGEKMDRRVRKTRTQLKEGLARLMQKKSINEITVKELVDEVDINRSTFYLHYTDIYQMLQQIEEEAMEEIKRVMKDYPPTPTNKETAFHFVVEFFSILYSNRDLCLALLGPNGDMAFVEKIENLIAGTFLKQLPRNFSENFPEGNRDFKYAYSFCLNGCVGLIKTWLSDLQPESAEHMAQLTYQLIDNTTESYLTSLMKQN